MKDIFSKIITLYLIQKVYIRTCFPKLADQYFEKNGRTKRILFDHDIAHIAPYELHFGWARQNASIV